MKAKVRQLIHEQNFKEARKACKKLCAKTPNDAEAQFLLGSIYVQLGDYSSAINPLKLALAAAPMEITLNFNLGTAYFHLKRYKEATEMFVRTAQLDPKQFDVWVQLGQSCEASGEMEHAVKSYEKALELQPESIDVLQKIGTCLLKVQQWEAAGEMFYRLIKLNPDDQGVINNFGITMTRMFRYEQLVDILEPIALNKPLDLAPNYYLGLAYMEQGEIDSALRFFDRVLKVHVNHVESNAAVAAIYYLKGQHDEALKCIQPLVKKHPDEVIVALTYASIGAKFGDNDQVINLLKRHIKNTKIENITRGKILATLGMAYEKMGDFDQAFKYIEQGNKLYPNKFDRNNYTKSIELLESIFTKESIKTLPSSGCESNQPVFIVGMPRSGTTLIEQILASHSHVFGAGELKYIQNYCIELHNKRINGKGYPQSTTDVSPDDLSTLAKRYLAHLTRLSGGSDRVTDKMPSNFQYVGLIHQLFPNAKIIHVTRNPMDTCMSCYSYFFGGALHFAYDLSDLGFYYRSYERVMRLWNKVLPDKILNVSYEELVKNQESETRKMLAFCDLPWEENCLSFHKTTRVVATASTDQVREPIHTGAIEKWKRYEKHLGELIASLEENKFEAK